MINGIKTVAILLAAGRGKRMQSEENKVYMDLLGRPLICYPLEALENSKIDSVIMTVNQKDIDYIQSDIIEKNHFTKVDAVIPGGRERFESVYFGLLKAEELSKGEECFVLIHDGARAFITEKHINQCIEQVDRYKACVMGMPVKDTIRMVDQQQYGVSTPERASLWITQTPQCFVLSEIAQAYKEMMQSGDEDITDDVMVLERYGNRKVKMIQGGYDNIKVTTPEDIPMGEAILRNRIPD